MIHNLEKKLIQLIVVLFSPFVFFGQDIPKYAKAIYVKDVSFMKAKNALLDSGYFIEQQSEEDGTIVTKEFNGDTYRMFGQNLNRYAVVMFIRVKDSTAKIMAKWAFNNEGDPFAKKQFQDLEYWKLKSSVPHALFMILDKYARSLGGEINYSLQ